MRRFLAMLLVCCLMPALAGALPATPYDPGLMLRYQTLTQPQRELFDLAYAAASAGESTFRLPAGTTYDDTVAAMNAFMDDCPELCALARSYSVAYYQYDPQRAKSVTLSYAMPLSAQETLMQVASSLAAQAEGDAYSRELFLHDALCAMTRYDLTGDAQASAYGALVEGAAGCEGYARALVMLCRLAGIPAGLVTGTADAEGDGSERHAWCILSVGGVIVQTDPTWDDQDGMGVNSRWYFNLSDAQMARDHQVDETLTLPACTDSSLNWHAQTGNLVPADPAQGEAVIQRALRQFATEKTAVNLRFEDAQMAAAFVDQLDDVWNRYNDANADAPFYGACRAAISVSQGCVMILYGE